MVIPPTHATAREARLAGADDRFGGHVIATELHNRHTR